MLLSTEELRRAEAFEHGKTLEHGKIKFEHEKSTSLQCREVLLVRLTGIEPTHPAPEAGALSTELQAHIVSLKHRAYILYQTFQKKARGFPKFFRFFLRLYAFAKKFDFFPKNPLQMDRFVL